MYRPIMEKGTHELPCDLQVNINLAHVTWLTCLIDNIIFASNSMQYSPIFLAYNNERVHVQGGQQHARPLRDRKGVGLVERKLATHHMPGEQRRRKGVLTLQELGEGGREGPELMHYCGGCFACEGLEIVCLPLDRIFLGVLFLRSILASRIRTRRIRLLLNGTCGSLHQCFHSFAKDSLLSGLHRSLRVEFSRGEM